MQRESQIGTLSYVGTEKNSDRYRAIGTMRKSDRHIVIGR